VGAERGGRALGSSVIDSAGRASMMTVLIRRLVRTSTTMLLTSRQSREAEQLKVSCRL